jgi:hypothetical protein
MTKSYNFDLLAKNKERSDMRRLSTIDPDVHLIIAISLSMIITFGLHCAMKDVPARASLFQHVFLDILRVIFLLFRCYCYDLKSKIFIRSQFGGNKFI